MRVLSMPVRRALGTGDGLVNTKFHQPDSATATTDNFLNWVVSTLGKSSASKVRQTRLTWFANDNVSSSRLKVQIRSSVPEIWNNLDYPGLQKLHGKGPRFSEKTDFTMGESVDIVDSLLRRYWSVFDENGLNKSTFLRPLAELKEDKVVVEFGSPNIAKPLHMGHLRSFVTGHYCSRICRAAGHPVKTICFLGDWGTQFGILQAGLAKNLMAERDDTDIVSVVKDLSLDELLQQYITAVQQKEKDSTFAAAALKLSAQLEDGDAISRQVWSTIREKTINHLELFWAVLKIKYDLIQGESEFAMKNHYTEEVLRRLQDLGVLEVGQDKCTYALLKKDEKFDKDLKITLVKSDGSSLYLLRDVACALARKEGLDFTRQFYVVDKTQTHHFIALFRILELLNLQHDKYADDGWKKKLWHVTFGKVAGQSTRSGQFVLLSDVINTGSSIMQENRLKSPNVRNQKDASGISTNLAISALIVNSLKARRNRDLTFNWDEALRPSGDTGVSLQYTHARLNSLEQVCKAERSSLLEKIEESFDAEYIIQDPLALSLAVQLINFEDAFWFSYAELEPCHIVTYLFHLSDKVSKALKHLKVMTEPNENVAATRLYLFILSRKILAGGLDTLGIEPLTEV